MSDDLLANPSPRESAAPDLNSEELDQITAKAPNRVRAFVGRATQGTDDDGGRQQYAAFNSSI